MKENLLLLKDLLEPQRTKFISIWLQYQKNVHIDKLDNIVNKYNNTCHSTIKMETVDVKSNTYINFSKEINDKDAKLKIGDIVRMSKYKNIFAKVYIPNWSEEMCRRHIYLLILTEKKLLKLFTKKNFKKHIKKAL